LDDDDRRLAAIVAANHNRLDLSQSFTKDLDAPSLREAQAAVGLDGLRDPASEVMRHAALLAWLGEPAIAGSAPSGALIPVLQRHLEKLGRLYGAARAGRNPSTNPTTLFRSILDFLRRAGADAPNDSDSWRLDRVVDTVIDALVVTARALGRPTFDALTELVEAGMAAGVSRLRSAKTRRLYAIACFREDNDTDAAIRRLNYKSDLENTPHEQLAEIASTASAYVVFGKIDRARALLSAMHEQGLGYSRPAKKDAQYLVWRDLFTLANVEDPQGRSERLRFLGRLLTGLADTEGRDAACRISPHLLEEAARAGAAWALSATDRMETSDLATWTDLVRTLAVGVASAEPNLALAASQTFGRLALPFTQEHDNVPFPELIRLAPTFQVADLVRRAVLLLEADSQPGQRIALLQATIEAAATRGATGFESALARWRNELPPPKSGSSPEDPFYLVQDLQTAGVIVARLNDDFSLYGIRGAFDRLAPRTSYSQAKALFDTTHQLQNSPSSLEIMIRLAQSSGELAAAKTHLAALKSLADGHGSWGGWLGDARLRYFRARVSIEGEPARQAAFDAFLGDIHVGTQFVDYLPHNLPEILDIVSPRPTWADAWSILAAFLSHFREYRTAQNLEPQSGISGAGEIILADLLYRAFDTGSVPLSNAARALAVELLDLPEGTAILRALLPRLFAAGGELALEAAQVAWDCRDSADMVGTLTPLLPDLCKIDDIAVRRIALSLASRWEIDIAVGTTTLPPIYSLHLPATPQAEIFDPPSGVSSSFEGLYTDNFYAWTWALKRPLYLAEKASGLPIINLRHRVGQIMIGMGGTAAFGPQANRSQASHLRRLRLETSYKKLSNIAAFQAMREVVGELESADALDPRALPRIRVVSGGFAAAVAASSPIRRPAGVSAPSIPDRFPPESADSWLEAAEPDLIEPRVEGWMVLAAAATHSRRDYEGEFIVEQYFGPEAGGPAVDLHSQFQTLPMVAIDDVVHVIDEAPAPGLVVWPEPILARSYGPLSLMFCPQTAASLGWEPADGDPFTFCDVAGKTMARTMFWRDGGELASMHDHAIHRDGCVVVVRTEQTKNILGQLRAGRVLTAWHSIQSVKNGNRVSPAASRRLGTGT